MQTKSLSVVDYQSISLSSSIIAHRVQDLADDVRIQLCEISKNIIALSLAVDENNDITDTAQLVIFIRGVNKCLEIREELLNIVPMKNTTIGDIFACIDKTFNSFNTYGRKLFL